MKKTDKTDERKKAALYLALINGSLLLVTLVFSLIFEPTRLIEGNPSYTCYTQRVVGIYCPGCGGTRALGYLLRFDLISVLKYYPPILVGLGLIIYIDIILVRCFIKRDLSIMKKHKYYEFLLIPASILLLFVVRNILLAAGIDYIGDIIK